MLNTNTRQGPYVIAEAGVNHNGVPELAIQLIDAAKEAGADAVKFQLFQPDELVTHQAELALYQKKTKADSQRSMLRSLCLAHSVFYDLQKHARQNDIDFLVTPFDADSAQFLVKDLGLHTLKIGSGELTNASFLQAVGKLNVDVIVSTGMADISDVEQALAALDLPKKKITLLHCTSMYPTPMNQVNLRAMLTLSETFHVPVGLSDHTEGIEIAGAATALGATVIEKHLTLDRSLEGPDHSASLEPDTFATMVTAIRNIAVGLGTGEKIAQAGERDIASAARRSIVTTVTIPKGTVLDVDMLAIKRPGTGIAPRHLNEVIGRKTTIDVPAHTPLQWNDL